MGREDILERLRVDPGRRTLGELLQEREAAAQEIANLRSQIDRLSALQPSRAASDKGDAAPRPFQSGVLIRLTEVCEQLGVSRATIYKWMKEGKFPEPVRIGERAVRWRTEDIESWRSAL